MTKFNVAVSKYTANGDTVYKTVAYGFATEAQADAHAEVLESERAAGCDDIFFAYEAGTSPRTALWGANQTGNENGWTA